MKWQHYLLIFLVLGSGGYAVYKLTRGVRNKNPGNIRFNVHNNWKGQKGKDDAGFVIFSDAKYGIRAIGKTLDSYGRRGINSVRDIIYTWAPTNENDTASYVDSVVSRTGFPPDMPLSREYGNWPELVKAIIHHENGFVPYSDAEIIQALEIA